MQSASADFATAMGSPSVVWTGPRVLVDWDGDGADTADPSAGLITIIDRFSRADPSGWGSAEGPYVPRSWTAAGGTTATDYPVTPGAGQHVLASVNTARVSTLDVSAGDVIVQCTVTPDAVATGATLRAGICVRLADVDNSYLFEVVFGTDSTVTAAILSRTSGSDSSLATGTMLGPYTAGAPIGLRCRANATSLAVKAWRDGVEDEPAEWTATVTDSSITAAGKIGLRSIATTGNTNTDPTISYGRLLVTTGTYDDLTSQSGDVTVTNVLIDNLPSGITLSSAEGAEPVTVGMVGTSPGWPLDAQAWWSPLRTDAPLMRYGRDTAPLTVAQGAVTAAGVEHVTLFTGKVEHVPVHESDATMTGISATRYALSRSVQPPVREAAWGQASIYGLTLSWMASWILHQCGVYPSPPARSGCRLWVPCHGGGNPYLPSTNPAVSTYPTEPGPTGALYTMRMVDAGTWTNYRARVVRGAYAGAIQNWVTDGEIRAAFLTLNRSWDNDLASGDDWLTTAGNRARVEFWVRGDAADYANAPGGAASFDIGVVSGVRGLAAVEMSSYVTTPYVAMGVGLDRKVFVTVYDGANTSTLQSTDALPSDGAWHFVGAAYDIGGNQLWVTLDDTTETSSPSPAMTTANLPASHPDGGAGDEIDGLFTLPVCEVQLSTGDGADPDIVTTWLNEETWTQGATIYPSNTHLAVAAATEPREAYEYLTAVAAAETAHTRITETDTFLYAPRGYWATTAAQTSAETITTARNAARPTVAGDPSRIRNVTRIGYAQTWTDANVSDVGRLLEVVAIPPGVTTVVFGLDYPTVRMLSGDMVNLTAADIASAGANTPGWSYLTVNAATDGSGAYATTAQVAGEITAWTADSATVVITNTTTATWYLANSGSDYAYLGIRGTAVRTSTTSVTEQYDASVTARGPRVLTADLGEVQTAEAAQGVARRLAAEYQTARNVVTVDVFADPRRQPGDLVTLDDPTTGLSGSWRTQQIVHRISGPDYTQTLRLERALRVGTWGDGSSRWGRSVWSGED